MRFVVEVRTGSLGTNRQDLLFGVPSTTLPTVGLLPTGSATIPEIALMKRTNQQGVCKIAAFAYDRMSGRPVWQSGNRKVASRAKDIWVMGAGPFQKGTIYDGTAFAGEHFSVPLVNKTQSESVSVAGEKMFAEHDKVEGQPGELNPVNNAGYNAPLAAANADKTAAPPATPLPSATPAGAPAAAGTTAAAAPATPPKAAYTPPPPVVVAAPPPVPGTGPQGNLTAQPLLHATANPATTASGAIQTYSWARDIMDRPKATTTTSP